MKASDFEVVWPLGRHPQPVRPVPGRPSTEARGSLDLNRAKVAFVWNYTRKGDRMFQIMQGMLRSEYPDISFVDYATFGNIHGASETEVVAALPQLLRQHEADIAVVGIGG